MCAADWVLEVSVRWNPKVCLRDPWLNRIEDCFLGETRHFAISWLRIPHMSLIDTATSGLLRVDFHRRKQGPMKIRTPCPS
jgi:hypothetical protein